MEELPQNAAPPVVIVTGGTRGLGAAISRAFAQNGCRVAAIYASDEEHALHLQTEIGCSIYRCDVASPEDCFDATRRIARDLGPCSILVNNAGINIDARFQNLTHDGWDKVIRVNLGGCVNMCEAVLPRMRDRKYGRIIHISSVVTTLGGIGISNYVSSKAAIEGYSQALAVQEARFTITSNVIAAGYLDVGMIRAVPEKQLENLRARIPLGRLGRANEVAHAAVFLTHELSAFITGAVIPVNGGLSAAYDTRAA
ncbi:SDR family oxidoreductase [Sphingomonas oryzagri]